MKLTIDIIKDIISTLTFDIKIKTIASNGVDSDGLEKFKITTCNTYHLTPNCFITLDSKEYKIISLILNESLTIKETTSGQGQPNITTINVPIPFYKHGTAIDVNNELIKVDDSELKFPLVYVLEPFSERFFDDRSAIDRNSNMRMFFLSNFNREDFNTRDHYDQIIGAMNNLADEFLNYIEGNKGYSRVESHNRTNWVNLSVMRSLKGQETQIFNDFLSGTEISFELEIKNCLLCK